MLSLSSSESDPERTSLHLPSEPSGWHGKPTRIGLDVLDRHTIDGLALAAVVFECFEFGAEGVVEAVDHVEHRRRHRDFDDLDIAKQATHGFPDRRVALG